jgi:hypothetical protein
MGSRELKQYCELDEATLALLKFAIAGCPPASGGQESAQDPAGSPPCTGDDFPDGALPSDETRVYWFQLPTFPFQLLPLRRIIARLFVMGGTIANLSVGQGSQSGHTRYPALPLPAYHQRR